MLHVLVRDVITVLLLMQAVAVDLMGQEVAFCVLLRNYSLTHLLVTVVVVTVCGSMV